MQFNRYNSGLMSVPVLHFKFYFHQFHHLTTIHHLSVISSTIMSSDNRIDSLIRSIRLKSKLDVSVSSKWIFFVETLALFPVQKIRQ